MTDTNRIALTYGQESAYGTVPSSFKTMRITGESLHQETSTVTSAEIRADRQIADVVRSNLSVAGDTSIELSYSFSDLLTSALMASAFTTELAHSSTGTRLMGADTSGGAGNHKFTEDADGNFNNFTAGQWIKTSGFANATNNGYWKIKSIGTNEIVVYGSLGSTEVQSAVPTATQGGQIYNGNTQTSYTIERVYTDITAGNSGRCAQYTGCMVDGVSINATTEAVVTGSFSWLGAVGASLTTETDTSPDDASGNDVMNAIDDVKGVMEGEAYGAKTITAFSMSLANNLRPRLEIGTLGAVAIGTGTCNVSGTFQRYYSDSSMIDKYLNFNDSSLAIVFEDSDGNAYCLDFPKIIYTSAQRVAGGQNQDLIADMSWEAVRDDTEDITIRISKWTA